MTPSSQSSPPSLRNRYIVFTLILSLVIVSISLLIYTQVVSTNEKAAALLLKTSRQSELVSDIRGETIDVYRSINLFLLDPTDGNHRQIIHDYIHQAKKNNRQIQQMLQAQPGEAFQASAELKQKLSQLEQNVNQLIETRLDVNRQYPAMSISAFEMGDMQSVVNSQFSILLDEIENGDFEPESAKIYPLLLKTETLWAKAISQVRIYLANRFTSFSKDILVIQADSLESIYYKLMHQLNNLQALYEQETESFEGLAAINTSLETVQQWHKTFGAVRKITESNHWREDSHLMKSSILPLLDDISTILFSIDTHLKLAEESTTRSLKTNNYKLIFLLVVTIVLFLIYILAIHVSLDVMIFLPISNVALALKSKAFDMRLSLFLIEG